jgi:all-trans-retinol dehydrogenase (NAD+)
MSEFVNKNVLITGGASGMGRRLALQIAHLGGNPILWDISRPNLDTVVSEISAATGREPHSYFCDVSNRTSVYVAARQVATEVGPVDILISSAGIVSGKPLLEIPDEKIEATFGVNTLSLFWTAKAFLPQMVERNSGHIVTIASASGYVGVARLSDYAASKWAAVGFDESLRVELKQIAPKVRTTVVCPYFVDTGMFAGVKSRFSFLLPILKEEKVVERIIAAIQANKRRLIMPGLVKLVPLMRALPVPIFDGVNTLLGINRSMDKFVGREGAPPTTR